MGIIQKIQGSRVYLDANIFIYALEGYPGFVEVLNELFTAIDNGQLQAVTSELSLAEVLIKPMMDNNAGFQDAYQKMIETSQALYVAPVSREILIRAASLRASNAAIKLPDAIHAATAQACHCQTIITNDKQLRVLAGLTVILPSDITRPVQQ